VAELSPPDASLRADLLALLEKHAGAATVDTSRPQATTSAAPPPLAGELVAGRYQLVRLLGRGGMSDVYLADDLLIGQAVAIKFLIGDAVAARDTAVLATEARVARVVTHPNVCRVFDIGVSDGRSFLTMEYIDGEDLAERLSRGGRPTLGEAAVIARDIVAGLAAVHAAGILHRDLKPSNVLLDKGGRGRLSDFGIAWSARGADHTRPAGTAGYMAPELLADGPPTVRTDMFALGALLYELHTGAPAFPPERPLAEPPLAPSVFSADIDPRVERVILECLDPDPERRPASARAVLAALPGGRSLAATLEPEGRPFVTPATPAAAPRQLSLAAVASLVGMTALALAAAVALADSGGVGSDFSLDKSPAELSARACELLDQAGHPHWPIADRAHGYLLSATDFAGLHEARPVSHAPESGPPLSGLFWYRDSTDALFAPNVDGMVFPDNPPRSSPGHRLVVFDT
ncbi:MAG: serine/threonine protein kinase, partial [Gemmataceae bacterium]|nr:serine/threonine protein kinase [Gemmataceae bacterium]